MTHSPSHQQRGMTLLETLIAIVVMALAILGVLAMQMRVLSETQTGVRRAQAIRLIESLAEQVRLNPGSGDATVAAAYTKPTPTDQGCSASTACSAAQLAETSVARWKQSVSQTLPGGQAKVFFVSDDGSGASSIKRQLAIQVAWRDGEQKTGDTAKDQELRKAFADAAKFTNAAGREVPCPSKSICHVQFIPLNTRCLPDASGGRNNIRYYCAEGMYRLAR